MDLRVGGGGVGHGGHHEGGQRTGRIMAGEEAVRRGYIDVDQPIHGTLPPAAKPDRESHSESQRGPTSGDSQPRRAIV